MKNYWLIQILLDEINTALRKQAINIRGGKLNAFQAAYDVVADYIEKNAPSFKTSSEYKRLDLCYSRSRGFFVELSEE